MIRDAAKGKVRERRCLSSYLDLGYIAGTRRKRPRNDFSSTSASKRRTRALDHMCQIKASSSTDCHENVIRLA